MKENGIRKKRKDGRRMKQNDANALSRIKVKVLRNKVFIFRRF